MSSVLVRLSAEGVPLIATAPNELAPLASVIGLPAAYSVSGPEMMAPPLCVIPPPPFKVSGVAGTLSAPATLSVPVPMGVPMVKAASVPIGNSANSAEFKSNPGGAEPVPPTVTLTLAVDGWSVRVPAPVTGPPKAMASPVRVMLVVLNRVEFAKVRAPVPEFRASAVPDAGTTVTGVLKVMPIPPRLPVRVAAAVL